MDSACVVSSSSSRNAYKAAVAQQLTDLDKRVLQAIQSRWSFFWNSSSLKSQITSLIPGKVNELMNHVMPQLGDDFEVAIERLAEIVPQELLEAAVKIDFRDAETAQIEAGKLLHAARYYLERTGQDHSPTIKARLQKVYESFVAILESILAAFGIAELFKPAENDLHAMTKGQKILMVLNLFSIIATVLMPILGSKLSMTILGSTFLSIATLSVIFPHIRPSPSRLPQAVNWTKEYREGRLPIVEGREKVLDEMARTFTSSKKEKSHVMLLGPTGVGKTETAKAFMKAIEDGRYPELRGKKVFYINAGDLITYSEMFSGNKVLERISEAMGSDHENIILVIDEIHLACQRRENSVLSEQLKTRLDKGGEGSFPYVIGITTAEEYGQDISQNSAFVRRFHTINVSSTGKEETLFLLNNCLLENAPDALLDKGVLECIYEQTKDQTQPFAAIRVLLQCIDHTSCSGITDLEREVTGHSERIRWVQSSFALMDAQKMDEGRSISQGESSQFDQAIRELTDKQRELEAQKKEIAGLFERRGRMAKAKKALFQTAVKISMTRAASQTLMNKQMLLQRYYIPENLTVIVKNEQLAKKVAITKELVDQVIRENPSQPVGERGGSGAQNSLHLQGGSSGVDSSGDHKAAE